MTIDLGRRLLISFGVEIVLVNVGFSDDGGQVLLLPLLGRHVLLEDHHVLKVHPLELFRVFQDYGG